MTASRRRFSQEVISTSKPIREVAESYGVGPETLRNWLIKYRDANGGTEEDLTLTEGVRPGSSSGRTSTSGQRPRS